MKHLKEHPGYSVDKEGNVYSFWRRKNGLGKKRLSLFPKKLKPIKYSCGYFYVNLGTNKKSYRVNRLIAFSFLKNPGNKPHVARLNGNRLDNRVVNLAWVTPKENEARKEAHGTRPDYNGIRNNSAKFNKKQIKEIRKRYVPYKYSVLALAKEHKVSTGCIYNIIKNISYKSEHNPQEERRVID